MCDRRKTCSTGRLIMVLYRHNRHTLSFFTFCLHCSRFLRTLCTYEANHHPFIDQYLQLLWPIRSQSGRVQSFRVVEVGSRENQASSSWAPTNGTPSEKQENDLSFCFVVTGFGPFNGVPDNPTSVLVKKLPGYLQTWSNAAMRARMVLESATTTTVLWSGGVGKPTSSNMAGAIRL